jgi:hypothetical protein
MNTKEREQLERLIGQLEDSKQVRDAYVIPSGHTRQFADGYKAGAEMQAGAVAMALRGICGIPKEDDEVFVSAMRRRA